MPVFTGAVGYQIWAILTALAGAYAVLWPHAVIGAVVSGERVPPSSWFWLPMAAVPRSWRRLWHGTRQVRWPALVNSLSLALRLPVVLIAVLWWRIERQMDQRTLRRYRRGTAVNVIDLQGLFAELRHPGGIYALLGAIRRQELRCGPDELGFLEELAARAEEPAPQRPRRRVLDLFRRQDLLRSPRQLPDRGLDQIALITEARLRATESAASQATSGAS